MLEIIAAVLVALWLLGFISSYTMGGFIHILLVIAVVVILVRIISVTFLKWFYTSGHMIIMALLIAVPILIINA